MLNTNNDKRTNHSDFTDSLLSPRKATCLYNNSTTFICCTTILFSFKKFAFLLFDKTAIFCCKVCIFSALSSLLMFSATNLSSCENSVCSNTSKVSLSLACFCSRAFSTASWWGVLRIASVRCSTHSTVQ